MFRSLRLELKINIFPTFDALSLHLAAGVQYDLIFKGVHGLHSNQHY